MKKLIFISTLFCTIINFYNNTCCMKNEQKNFYYSAKCKDGSEIFLTKCENNLEKEKALFKKTFTKAYQGTEIEKMILKKHKDLSTFCDAAFEDEENDFKSKKENSVFINAKNKDFKTIGFIAFDKLTIDGKNKVYVRQLAVDPELQKSGIGKILTYAFLKEWIDISQIYLMTRRLNKHAVDFYTHLGFKESSFVHEGLDPKVYIGMEKNITKKEIDREKIKYEFVKTWQDVFSEKEKSIEKLVPKNSLDLIKAQIEAQKENKTPSIAKPEIKSINIVECHEALIDVKNMKNPRIIMLPDSKDGSTFSGAEYNSGFSCSSKIRATLWEKIEKLLENLDTLAEEFGYKPGQITIKVFEGLRDINTQAKLFENKLSEIKLQNPSYSQEQAEAETCKWVSPVKNNVPVHSTGAAIDIRLWDTKTNDFVDLGKFGVIWGENNGSQTFSENTTYQQKINRLYLLSAASMAGLVNYPYEYWHFSTGDRYAAYWLEKDESKRLAIYGSVKL